MDLLKKVTIVNNQVTDFKLFNQENVLDLAKLFPAMKLNTLT